MYVLVKWKLSSVKFRIIPLVLFPTLFIWFFYTYEIKGATGLTLSGLALMFYVCIHLGATWVYAIILDAILKEAERDGSLELLLEA